MNRLPLLMLGLIALPGVGRADVVTLKDGSKLEGEIRRTGDVYVVKEASGTITNIPLEKVDSISVKPPGSADAVMGRLQSLRRAAENISDLHQILDRFHSFIEQNPGTPAADAAQKDVQMWQDRLDHGLVKVGDKWMNADERDALRGKSTDVAIQLHDLLKSGKLKEAGVLLDRALQIDPQNMSLLYLHGVMQYQQELIPVARRSFEAVIASAPDHAPTLNNLGVILGRQKAPSASLTYYDRAMLAAPGSQEILDNVAEALNSLPKEQRDTPLVKKVVRHFKEQDAALQKKMAAKGEYRWGSVWVDEKELKKLQDEEKVVKDQITQMANDFDSVQKRIAQIDRQIADIANEMNLIDAQSYVQGPNGQMARVPYPPVFFTLSQQLGGLKTERAARVDDLDKLRKAANQAQGKLPAPKYTGMQKIIDADGMPLPAGAQLPPPPVPAAVQPAAAPAAGAPMPAPTTQPAPIVPRVSP